MNVITLNYIPRPQFAPYHRQLFRWSCIVAHRRCGKTVAVVRQLERGALTCPLPNPRFAYIAPQYKQAKDVAWQYVKEGAIPLVPHGAKINESELRVDYPNGGRLRLYGADNPDSLRGIYLDGVGLDEYADMKPNMWSEVIRPALSDRKGWATFIGTPKGRDNFYSTFREYQKDPKAYTAQLRASQTGILPEEELADARRSMSASEYAREYECSFDEPAINQFIGTDLVDAARGREAGQETPVLMGVDVARFGNDRTCFVIRKGDSIEKIDRIHGIDTMQTAAKAAELIDFHGVVKTFVDGVGVGGGVVDRLAQLGYKPVDVSAGGRAMNDERYANKRAEMWGVMRDWISKRGSLPADNAELVDDLVAPTYKFDSSNRIQLEKKEDMKKRGLPSPDIGDALALTFAFPVAQGSWEDRPIQVHTTRGTTTMGRAPSRMGGRVRS